MNQELFCKRLKELIESSNLTYEEIKEKLGLKSKGSISKYLNGKVKNITIEMTYNIANSFGVSPCWLAGWSDDKYYGIKKEL